MLYRRPSRPQYEPELFPGLIYRMKKPKIVLLIFVSGKVVLTGAKRRSEIYEAFENIYPILTEFRKGDAVLPGGVPTDALRLPAPAGQQLALPEPPEGGEAEPRLPPPTPRHPGLPPPTPHHPGLPPPTPYNPTAYQ